METDDLIDHILAFQELLAQDWYENLPAGEQLELHLLWAARALGCIEGVDKTVSKLGTISDILLERERGPLN